MAKSLGKTEDIQQTSASMESGGQSLYLSIPDSKTPWYLLGLEYTSFFSHWYEGPQGRRSVVCAGGVEGGGFATDDCEICEHTLELYQEGKRLREEENEQAAGNKLKNRANDIRGKGAVVLKAIRGQYVLIKDKNGKKHQEADFELDPDNEDSNVDVGLLSLSEAQWEGLTGMINGEHTPFIKDGKQLATRVLFTKKERRKGKTTKYTAVVWGAEKEETDMPEVEISKELDELDLDELGVIDVDEVTKVAAYLTGQDSEDVDDDEEVELEDDSEDEPDDSYLDDVEDDEEPGDDETPADDDFEDDIPWEEEEEAEDPPKRTTGKPASTSKKGAGTGAASGKRTTSKKTSSSARSGTGSTSKKTGSKKSGKSRL